MEDAEEEIPPAILARGGDSGDGYPGPSMDAIDCWHWGEKGKECAVVLARWTQRRTHADENDVRRGPLGS